MLSNVRRNSDGGDGVIPVAQTANKQNSRPLCRIELGASLCSHGRNDGDMRKWLACSGLAPGLVCAWLKTKTRTLHRRSWRLPLPLHHSPRPARLRVSPVFV